jgi:hypothetical protein
VRRWAVVFGMCVTGCGNPSHAPPLDTLAPPDDASVDGSGDAPNFDIPTLPAIDCSKGRDAGYCGCTELAQKTPLLYLVLDRSGSMAQPFAGTTRRKWDVVTSALLDLSSGALRKLGTRVTVGATTFPGATACAAGAEVFAPALGGDITYRGLATLLDSVSPIGGTPTASTLTAVRTRLKGLPTPAYVLLATDGGPNCAHTPCSAATCEDNIDGLSYGKQPCDASFNCCDPSKVPATPGDEWSNCVDQSNTVLAISSLFGDGVKTFVVGVPGSEAYASILDAMADAGGTARTGTGPHYYAAADPTELSAALSAIAAKVVTTCTITLADVPPDALSTNVLLDGDVIPQDPVDGWTWGPGRTSVILHGASCDRVNTGVSSIQVATGCRTITK